jgi:hypothetical protein
MRTPGAGADRTQAGLLVSKLTEVASKQEQERTLTIASVRKPLALEAASLGCVATSVHSSRMMKLRQMPSIARHATDANTCSDSRL